MSGSNAQSGQLIDPPIFWSAAPGETDILAWAAIISMALAIFLIMLLYSKFDEWAEHKAEGTPLAKTIPTMLTIALLYEIFPLDHFSILLPLSAILIALMADWMRGRSPFQSKTSENLLIEAEQIDMVKEEKVDV